MRAQSVRNADTSCRCLPLKVLRMPLVPPRLEQRLVSRVSRVLVVIMANAFGTADDETFSIQFTVTGYSVLTAFSIGLILTLATVIFSAYRVSKLNIVVAIRNLPEEFVASTTKPILRRLLGVCVLGIRSRIRARWSDPSSVRRHEDVGIAILKLVFTLLHRRLGDRPVCSVFAYHLAFQRIQLFSGNATLLPREFVARENTSIPSRIGEFLRWIIRPVIELLATLRSIWRHEDVRSAFLKLVVTLEIVAMDHRVNCRIVTDILAVFKQGWPYALIGVAVTALGFLNESALQAYIGASVAVYGFTMLALAIMVRVGVREAIASTDFLHRRRNA